MINKMINTMENIANKYPNEDSFERTTVLNNIYSMLQKYGQYSKDQPGGDELVNIDLFETMYTVQFDKNGFLRDINW